MTAAKMVAELRQRILERIEQVEMSPDRLSEKLGLLPVGAEILLMRTDWTFETAVLVAEAVGLDVNVMVTAS